MLECAYSIYKMYFVGGQFYQNVNKLVQDLLVNKNAIFETIYLYRSDITLEARSTPHYITLCYLFGQTPHPRRVTDFLNGLLCNSVRVKFNIFQDSLVDSTLQEVLCSK